MDCHPKLRAACLLVPFAKATADTLRRYAAKNGGRDKDRTCDPYDVNVKNRCFRMLSQDGA